MKKLILSLALGVIMFAGVGLAGGAGVAFAHEGQGDPPLETNHIHADDAHATDVAFASFGDQLEPGLPGPAHFGHQNNPNCTMHNAFH